MPETKIPHQDDLDKTFRHLRQGKSYRVAKEFTDYDEQRHRVGESWVFIGSNFVPYDDGLSLYAAIDGVDQQIRLQWRKEEQGGIIEHLERYLVQK